MSTIMIDGFDHYNTNQILAKWDYGVFNGACMSSSAGRRGGGCLELGDGAYLYKQFAPADTVVFGAALCFTSLPTQGNPVPIAQWWGSSTVQATIWLDFDGTLAVYLGADRVNLLVKTGPYTEGYTYPYPFPGNYFTAGAYLYLEAKITFSDTVGSVTLHTTPFRTPRENGVSFASPPLVTSAGPVPSCDRFQWMGSASILRVDDFYLLDGSGSSFNDFLGDCRVDTSMPFAEGSVSQFTVPPNLTAPNVTVPNFEVVNDIPPDGDYVRGSFPNATDKYVMRPVVSVTGVIHTVQMTTYAKASVEGVSRINHVICNALGSDDVLSGTLEVGLGFKFLRTITPQRPATPASPALTWTAVGINGAQFGVKVAA